MVERRDVHAYFSPYTSPYEAYINYINALHDVLVGLCRKAVYSPWHDQ